jgi:GAF domain-containing protein
LLDSRQEEAFDRLTRRACLTIGVPAALVSLVDADRQFFKSAQGLREPFASARQTSLEHSFCQYVVAGERPLVVADARRVPLLADSAAITALDVIGYAGVPLCAHGHVLGAFCAIDAVPHEWSDADLALLQELVSDCSAEVHLRAGLRERRRAQGEQRFRALGDVDQGTARGRAHPLSEKRSTTLTALHAGARGDNRRWLHRELAIPVEANI